MSIHDLRAILVTTGGGIAIIGVALLLRRIARERFWLHAVVMLIGASFAVPELSSLLGLALDFLKWLLLKFAGWLATKGHAWSVVGTFFQVVGDGLTVIFALILVVWLLWHLFPRLHTLRGGGGGRTRVGGGATTGMPYGVPGAGGGLAGRLSGLHAVERYTMWLAFFTPAAVVLATPLSHLVRIHGGA
jgi:hypothetical protein